MGDPGRQAVLDPDPAHLDYRPPYPGLAGSLDADLFLIATAVQKVALRFGTPGQSWLDKLTVGDAEPRGCQPWRRGYSTAARAAIAEPRAPAMSRSGTSATEAAEACSSRSMVCSRTRPRNQSRKCCPACTTPPPRK